MGALRDQVVKDVLDEVRIIYLGRVTAKWWNARRRDGDVAAFCGWFWLHGNSESGPFRSRSAAMRDAYYRCVLRQDTPATGHALDDMARDKPRRRKRAANGSAAHA